MKTIHFELSSINRAYDELAKENRRLKRECISANQKKTYFHESEQRLEIHRKEENIQRFKEHRYEAQSERVEALDVWYGSNETVNDKNTTSTQRSIRQKREKNREKMDGLDRLEGALTEKEQRLQKLRSDKDALEVKVENASEEIQHIRSDL